MEVQTVGDKKKKKTPSKTRYVKLIRISQDAHKALVKKVKYGEAIGSVVDRVVGVA